MAWWVLTYLDNYRDFTSLRVLTKTNNPAHLMMAWSTVKPARRPVYRTVRGTQVFCGWKYIWNSPNLTEQHEPGDTFTHTFGPITLEPTDHVWYLLSSTRTLYEHYCQSPLIHVWPPELPMPSARVFNSLDQPIPRLVETALSYDSVAWDTGGFYNPATPTRLTAPLDGLYAVGACQHVSFPHDPGHRIRIRLNGANAILVHGHRSLWPDPAGSTTSLHAIIRLREGHFLQVTVYHWAAGPRNVASLADYSPHFWIAYLAPYPE